MHYQSGWECGVLQTSFSRLAFVRVVSWAGGHHEQQLVRNAWAENAPVKLRLPFIGFCTSKGWALSSLNIVPLFV